VTDDLRDEFEDVGAVLPDVVVAVATGSVYHRPDPCDPEAAACNSHAEWSRYRRERLEERGFDPCGGCFRSALECLAAAETSPVALRDGQTATADGGEVVELSARDRRRLDTLTDEFLFGGTGMAFHAPADDGALCGKERWGDKEFRRVDREMYPAGGELCNLCFAESVEFTGRE